MNEPQPPVQPGQSEQPTQPGQPVQSGQPAQPIQETPQGLPPQQSGQPGTAAQPMPEPSQPGRDWWFVAHRRFSVVGAALAIMVVFWLALNILVSGALGQVFGGNVPDWAKLLASSGPLYLVAMPVSMAVFTRVPAIGTRQYAMKSGEFIRLFIMCIPVMYLGNIIGMVLSAGVTDGQATNRLNDLVLDGNEWVNVLFIGLLAPICEEWLFRQQIISRLRRYGEKTAIMFSALAFALFHMNLFQFFYAFGLGLIFGYVYTRTSRLRYSVVMHMLINLNGSVLAPLMLKQIDPKILNGTLSESELLTMTQGGADMRGLSIVMLYGMVMLGLLIAGIVLLIVRRKSWEFYAAPEELPAGLKVRTAYGNPGVVIYLLLTVGMTIWMLLA